MTRLRSATDHPDLPQWWKWSSDPTRGHPRRLAYNHASANNSDFYPQHKPTEAILRQYYRTAARGGR